MIHSHARMMIDLYDEWISKMTCVGLYGPPEKQVYYWQLHGGETREQDLRESLERLTFWTNQLESLS